MFDSEAQGQIQNADEKLQYQNVLTLFKAKRLEEIFWEESMDKGQKRVKGRILEA